MSELPFDPRECALALTSVALRDVLTTVSRLILLLEHGKHHGIGMAEAQALLAELGPQAEAMFGSLVQTAVIVARTDLANLPVSGQRGQA